MRLVFRERGSLRCHHILNSRLKERDQIELSFANDGAIGFDQCSFRFMESEKDPTFSKDRRFWGINVFSRRRLSGENAPRKSDDFADVVANRKHQPAAEAIVELAITAFFVTQFHQAAREQFPPAIAFLARPLAKRIPTFRRVTQLP